MGVEEITQYPPHPNPLPQGGEEDRRDSLNIYKIFDFFVWEFFDTKFKIDEQILPPLKICPKKKVARKKNFVFPSCFVPKRGSRLGTQAMKDTEGG